MSRADGFDWNTDMFPDLSDNPSDSLPSGGWKCSCERMCSPKWNYCPWCGQSAKEMRRRVAIRSFFASIGDSNE